MTELAWMKTYIGDEAALTGHLTAEEFGAFERLRRHFWQHGDLPEQDDEPRLARIVGIDPSRWQSIANAIVPLMANAMATLERERANAAGRRAKKVAAGHLGAAKRWGSSTENGKTSTFANGTAIADAIPAVMAEPLVMPRAPAPAPEDKGLGGKVGSHAHAPARETQPTEYPIDPPETVDQGRRFLEGKGVAPEDMEAKLTKLMRFRLYPSEIAA